MILHFKTNINKFGPKVYALPVSLLINVQTNLELELLLWPHLQPGSKKKLRIKMFRKLYINRLIWGGCREIFPTVTFS